MQRRPASPGSRAGWRRGRTRTPGAPTRHRLLGGLQREEVQQQGQPVVGRGVLGLGRRAGKGRARRTHAGLLGRSRRGRGRAARSRKTRTHRATDRLLGHSADDAVTASLRRPRRGVGEPPLRTPSCRQTPCSRAWNRSDGARSLRGEGATPRVAGGRRGGPRGDRTHNPRIKRTNETIRNSNRPKASSASSAFWSIASSLCTAGQRRRTSWSFTPIKTGLFPNRRKRDLARAGTSEVATSDIRSGRDCHERRRGTGDYDGNIFIHIR